MSLRDQIKQFPKQSGVYLMKDAKGLVLYVGKANNLRTRVRSYFQVRKDDRYQIQFLMRQVADIECVVTDTEKEALLLEHTLIHRHHPRYNIVFRDDRSFLSLRMTTQHPFPGIYLTRKVTQDGATYFGPYTSALACRETVEQITRFFRLRICNDRDFANRSRPCIQYQIGRCTAPCVGYVDQGAYARQVQDALTLLQGRRSELVGHIEHQMRAASAAEHFEEAARLRDLLRDIAVTVEPQHVVRHAAIDRDYVGWAAEGDRGAVALLEMRDGKVIHRSGSAVRLGGDEPVAHVISFLMQYYRPPRIPPKAIAVPFAPTAMEGLAAMLSERRGGRVHFVWPRRGAEAKLLRLAATNAQAYARTQQTADESWGTLAEAVRLSLQLPQPPTTIECVDISNWQGKEAVGSLVCFIEGRPQKNRYRHYNIRTVHMVNKPHSGGEGGARLALPGGGATQAPVIAPNDYAMMKEVLERRLKSETPRPDLLLIDGGKGQLQIAMRVIEELACLDLPLAAIAKPTKTDAREPAYRNLSSEHREREGGARRALPGGGATLAPVIASTDKVYLPGRKNPLALKPGNPVLLYLQRIRDEAHRFGITRVRKRVEKTSLGQQ